uniref:Protein FAM221B n=1 Tax=Chromera velia CCMP2878 TaxID=1169474 RepID=A0A0G4GRF0_9ALVE|eukprot:Cvel_23049.t1-p1 / transcript=Cvel_23049.t1 / gene=Cvel_23049 / organism=Chromera_velia_CCMP2878 / gene_product=Protein FAM221B, putative / transcript_product=Protein FAM221B, putative / location=Cvel_scaffold2332:3576-6246(+) / protein_length=443 / sequence_SO=supercontig / SO=protein_coding / is_pseudo=false
MGHDRQMQAIPEGGMGAISPSGRPTPSPQILQMMQDPQARDSLQRMYAAVKQYGPAPGAKQMLTWEHEAADHAMQTGIYGVFRCVEKKNDCSRVGPKSKCFCGHFYKDHQFANRRAPWPKCCTCACEAFEFIPTRPEEAGEWWLPRRPGFKVSEWRAKCKCGHTHEDHDTKRPHRCRLCPPFKCSSYTSAWLCVACDRHWEQHETVFETEQERRDQGLPVGEDFIPLKELPEFYDAVFKDDNEAARNKALSDKVKKPQPPAHIGLRPIVAPPRGRGRGRGGAAGGRPALTDDTRTPGERALGMVMIEDESPAQAEMDRARPSSRAGPSGRIPAAPSYPSPSQRASQRPSRGEAAAVQDQPGGANSGARGSRVGSSGGKGGGAAGAGSQVTGSRRVSAQRTTTVPETKVTQARHGGAEEEKGGAADGDEEMLTRGQGCSWSIKF